MPSRYPDSTAGCVSASGVVNAIADFTRFDAHVKAWRLFADGINNVGLTLDMIAPLHPARFAEIAAAAAVCKAMCGVPARTCAHSRCSSGSHRQPGFARRRAAAPR